MNLTDVLIMADIFAILITVVFCTLIEDRVVWSYKRYRKAKAALYQTIYRGTALSVHRTAGYARLYIDGTLMSPIFKNTSQAKKYGISYIDKYFGQHIIFMGTVL